ncbi:gluconokinase [Microbacterium hominis]|uniref:gluconokinase n=1 Tax=Microbacterium hominis TaxID=162426 RepID=UPI00349F656E
MSTLETPVAGAPHRVRVVVMGVSAVGKSSVALALAERLGVPMRDADDLHPSANVEKMRAGTPLTDADRGPWLDLVGAALAGAEGGVVMACSALRRRYRDRLRLRAPGVVFVHLTGSPELLAERAAGRADHFMPPALLASQLATLEPLEDDEPGIALDVAAPIEDLAARAGEWLGAHVG